MKRIFHILSILVVCVVACNVARAQSTTPKTSSGDKALLFSINGFGTFGVGGSQAGVVPFDPFGIDSIIGAQTVFPVAGVGMKFFVADRTALRFGVGFGLSSTTIHSNNDTVANSKKSQTIIGISPAIEIHMVNAGPVSGYVGGLLSFASIGTTDRPSDADSNETSTAGSVFGIGGMIGAEFFPWSNISLSAEYQLTAQFLSQSSTNTKGVTTDGDSVTLIGISSLAVVLGIYW